MAELDPRAIQAALSAPFAPEDLEWRIQTALKDKLRGLAVPYVTNRAIQSRLDDVVGPENWRNEYQPWHSSGKKAAQICGISLYFEGRGWITKWDGAEDSDIEPIKGGLSDSMKRAAVHWGIGRVLYNLDTVWVDIEARGNSFVIKDSERPRLNRAYIKMLDDLHLLPAAPTGAQAQLTPTPPKEKESGGKSPSESPAQKPNQPPAGRGAAPQDSPKTPEYEYVVQLATVQRGMSSISTALTLISASGKKKQVYAQGARDDLIPGVMLRNVKLTQRQQDTVVFYMLESYEIMAPVCTAA